LALAELGDVSEARRLAQEEVALARVVGSGRTLGVALRALALMDRDLELMDEAVTALDRSGSELEYARALVDYGSALRRAGERTRGRALLRQGHECALRCGAALLAERARQELVAAGARPRRNALSGPESLTPSERRVVELAADELTNRQIAQTLYLTESTVETHLSHAFAKLDVRSRRALAGALASR
jgi:DNA-binding CsgD family transcriptional regulator